MDNLDDLRLARERERRDISISTRNTHTKHIRELLLRELRGILKTRIGQRIDKKKKEKKRKPPVYIGKRTNPSPAECKVSLPCDCRSRNNNPRQRDRNFMMRYDFEHGSTSLLATLSRVKKTETSSLGICYSPS